MLPSVVMWRKTRKRKSLVLSFTEARFRRTGAIFLCFSDNGGKHEASTSHTWVTHGRRGKEKRKAKPAVHCTLYPVPCTLYPVPCTLYPVPCTLYPVPCTLYPVHCTLYTVTTPIVQAIFPQIPAETAANMVLCRDNIFSKEMYASMRAKPMRRWYIWT